MIDALSVAALFRERFSSDADDRELNALCLSACLETKTMLKKESDENDIRIISLAAALVNYRLCRKNLSSGDGVTSFKAGDVTVTISPESLLENAEDELEREMVFAAPLLKDTGFLFRQVK